MQIMLLQVPVTILLAVMWLMSLTYIWKRIISPFLLPPPPPLFYLGCADVPKQNIIIFSYHPFLCVILVFLQGTTKVQSEAVGAVSKKEDLKDENLVFVAGATGRVGSRTVRLLSASNFTLK